MFRNAETVIKRIREILHTYDEVYTRCVKARDAIFYVQQRREWPHYMTISEISELVSRMSQTISDSVDANSYYFTAIKGVKMDSPSLFRLLGIIRAIKSDYEGGYLNRLEEDIDADVFSDILEQARFLRDQGFGRASAVVAGVSLESHLRKMAQKNSIPIENSGKYVKAQNLNDQLKEAGVYDKTLQKVITGWLGIRNDAAHPSEDDINEGLLEPMILGIRNLIEKYPA